MTSGRKEQAALLASLHHGDRPLVLPNVWDAVSARVVESVGFPVVATSSGALVRALGYEDGSAAPPDEVFAAVARIARSVAVPVTADLEDGYGLTGEELAGRLVAAGAVGCNLEDSSYSGSEPLVSTDVFAERVAAVKEAGRALGVDIVLNARIDVFLRSVGPPGDRIGAALERARAYFDAGADCVYPITASTDHEVATLVRTAGGPVNIMALAEPADVARLASLGAARISVGSGLATVVTSRMHEVVAALATALIDQGCEPST